jgi:hypothetical protein
VTGELWVWVRRLVAAALLTAATAVAFVREAHGQAAAVSVSAVLSPTALAVGSLRNLQFGNVTPGVTLTIDPRTSASAGEFEIQGTKNAEVAITMTLPSQLSTGFWTMPISFGPTSGCWKKGTGQAGCTTWDPSTVLIARIRNQNPPNNHLWVWLGGTVSPSPTQNPGVYIGSITLSVVYTGN